jgi:hypothetical protein
MKIAIVVVAAAGLQLPQLSSPAVADPVPKITIPTQLLDPATVTTDAGRSARLDAGDWLVPEGFRDDWDTETRRLQEVETRLEAENESLRESVRDAYPVWYYLAGAFVAGIAIREGYDEARSWF